MGYPQQYPPQYGAYPGYPPPHMYPPPRKPVWPWVVGGLVIAVAIVAAIGVVVFATHKSNGSEAAAAPIAIVYEVTGDATTPIAINYLPGEGDSVHVMPPALPWRMETAMTKLPHNGFVNAYTGTEYSGTGVTCRILRDGKVLVQDMVTGSGTASCLIPIR